MGGLMGKKVGKNLLKGTMGMFENILTAEKSDVGVATEEDIERRKQDEERVKSSMNLQSMNLQALGQVTVNPFRKGEAVKTKVVKRYLPKDIKGVPVMVPELGFNDDGTKSYMVDCAGLEAAGIRCGDRLAYRISKDMADKDEGRGAWWGEPVVGIDEEDGWIQVEVEIEDKT